MTDIDPRLAAALEGRYHLERELGAGGMATVYLAHDVRHDRDVAIKVLRPELAAVVGAQRFLAEIKTTAHLQHPHILSLFDSGEVDGTVYYVMPFVEGESLRDRLAREKQLPIADAVRMAAEVADALQYAHERGVIHRDIKPENILLQGGHALVADFGIALAASRTGGSRMTETGMSLGTPQYMSPEQAMGERELDARADIYALGCVLFEMLSGAPPFTGPTAQAVVAKVITEPAPSVRAARPTVPPQVDAAITTALQKLPADRFRTAAAFGEALTITGPMPAAAPAARDAAAGRAPGAGRGRAAMFAAAAVIAIAAFWLGGRVRGGAGAPPLVFGRDAHVTWDRGLEITPSISPDGRTVAYAAGPLVSLRVMVKPVSEGRAIALTGDTTAPESGPRWSPDGTRILFLSRGGAYSAPAGGGPARPEVPGDTSAPVTSATWSPDGSRIAFSRGDSLYVHESDGSTRPLASIVSAGLCTWQPTGTFIACASGNVRYAQAGPLFDNKSPGRIVLCRVADGAVTTITDSLTLNQSPTWSPDGRWVYFVSNRDGPRDIYGVSITASGRARGAPVRLSTGLGAHTISLAANGARMAYSRYSLQTSIWSVPIPTAPPASSAGATRVTDANETIESIGLSPDGKWVYYDSDLSGNSDLWRIPVAGGEPEQLTTDPADDFAPAVSPDGKEVAFHSWRSGSRDVYVLRLADGSVQQVTNTPKQEAAANWSPDGRALTFTDLGSTGIWIVRRDANGHWGEPKLRVARGWRPVWSPDGRWLAFSSSLTQGSIKVVPVDSGAERVVLAGIGPDSRSVTAPAWSDHGTLYFSDLQKGSLDIYEVPAFGGAPRLLVRVDASMRPGFRSTPVAGHGRFYFTTEDRQSDVFVLEVR